MPNNKPPLSVVNPNRSTAPQYCSIEDAEMLADGWSDQILACRSGMMRHSFGPWTAVHNKRYRYWFVTLRCPSCTCLKFYEMTENGHVLGKPWYKHPPGYLSKRGRIAGEAQDVIRIKAVQRLFEVNTLSANTKDAREMMPRPVALQLLEGDDG